MTSSTDVDSRLRILLSEIFPTVSSKLYDTLSVDTCVEWSSITHFSLMSAIEGEFSLEISIIDQLELTSVEFIKSYLSKNAC